MATPTGLRGLKVLVVEDLFLLGETIRDHLESCGCEVVGPAASLQRALELAIGTSLDGAVLDINLDGELSFPVAACLEASGVPFVFLTGYDDPSIVPAEFRSLPHLTKPCDYAELTAALANAFCKPGAKTIRPGVEAGGLTAEQRLT